MQSKYAAWLIYNDSNDRRLIVPKRRPGLGWTINVGHPMGWTVMMSIVALVAITIAVSVMSS